MMLRDVHFKVWDDAAWRQVSISDNTSIRSSVPSRYQFLQSLSRRSVTGSCAAMLRRGWHPCSQHNCLDVSAPHGHCSRRSPPTSPRLSPQLRLSMHLHLHLHYAMHAHLSRNASTVENLVPHNARSLSCLSSGLRVLCMLILHFFCNMRAPSTNISATTIDASE